jgi:tRNA pseudouridine55 synthase
MFILVDKPQWCTSHDVVDKIKRLYREEKVGHGGTLDPMATWLLVVAVGKDTKKLGQLLGATKTYTTTIDFSISTDTRDLDFRKEFTQRPVDHTTSTIEVQWVSTPFPSRQQIETTLQSIVGTHLLPLTPFSAKKIEGKKLYEYARAWTPIFMDVPMCVLSFEVLDITFPQVTIEIKVGSGTYIRSIGYRLGKQFWLGGTLSMLRRTQVGKLEVPLEN